MAGMQQQQTDSFAALSLFLSRSNTCATLCVLLSPVSFVQSAANFCLSSQISEVIRMEVRRNSLKILEIDDLSMCCQLNIDKATIFIYNR